MNLVMFIFPGVLRDITGSYDAAFYRSGLMLTVVSTSLIIQDTISTRKSKQRIQEDETAVRCLSANEQLK